MEPRLLARRVLVIAGVMAAVVATMAGMAACGGGDGESLSLDGTNWELVRWSESALSPSDFSITADFEDGRIGGLAAVNNYGGPYETGPDDEFSIGPLTSTMMAASGDEGRAERTYFDLLESAASYEVVGGTLTLYDEFGDEALVFESAEE